VKWWLKLWTTPLAYQLPYGSEVKERRAILTFASVGSIRSSKPSSWHIFNIVLFSHSILRREDVFISLVGTGRDDWSFGNGEAQRFKGRKQLTKHIDDAAELVLHSVPFVTVGVTLS
jgi:hypothetical protein